MPDATAGDGALERYWKTGAGAAKIAWGTSGDFTRCDAELSKHVGPEKAKRICAQWHQRHDGLVARRSSERLMAWAGSTRRQRLPDDWTERRAKVLARDRMRCQWVRADTGQLCGERANQVDHIDPGDDHDLINLQALCAWHHNKKSASEGGAGRAAARRATAGPVATHPGVLP